MIARMQRRNRYGTLQDYVDWALEVPGVTRAWAFAAGNVINVFFVMDDTYPDTYGIPQQTDAVILDAGAIEPASLNYEYLSRGFTGDEPREPGEISSDE